MSSTLSRPRAEIVHAAIPSALALTREIAAAPSRPRLRFVRGVAGSGKSAVLDTIREILLRNGTVVHTDPMAQIESGAALLIDDAHLLGNDARQHLRETAARGDVTIVATSEPRLHDRDLHDLAAALSKDNPVVELPLLDRGAVLERSSVAGRTSTNRGAVSPSVAGRIVRASGGIKAAVDSALSELYSDDEGEPDVVIARAVSAYFHVLISRCDPLATTVLAVAALGVAPDPETVIDVSDTATTRDEAVLAVDRARGTGLLTQSDAFLDSAHRGLRSVLGDHAVTGIHCRVVGVQLDRGALHIDIACAAARSGVKDLRLADALCEFASAAAPSAARELWDMALAAGASAAAVALPYSDAAAMTGDLDTAARLADSVMACAEADAEALRGAVRVAASIATRRGTYSRAADVYRWLGVRRVGPDAALAAVVLLTAGDRTGADAFLAAADECAPTVTNARGQLFARGVAESITGSATVAVGSLLRSASMTGTGHTPRAEPDSAAAAAALLCLHTGDLSGARSILVRALDAEPAGSSDANRFRLLLAWTTMIAGDLAGAFAEISAVSTSELPHREALLDSAVRVGLARRRGDAGALLAAWREAQHIVAEVEVDLFSLLPLGELWLAAIRLGDSERVAHLVDRARVLLVDLGEPVTWSSTWNWYGVQAAILSEDPAALLPHARALGVAAQSSAYAAGLAAAGRAWLRVLQGEPDAAEVEASARTLEGLGLSWDGARLASEAALRVTDTRSATTLLQTARQVGNPATAPTDRDDAAPAPTGPLTDREAEVAGALVLGLTYKEIGSRLFISAKTVEHHVARIRRRLGAGSRSEMLSMLRAAGYSPSETAPFPTKQLD
ncbi:LuxR family transcriptional regulator [Rhodococcoides trifolii]|uniref:LuxR family transcriptional regulator n=1 Tax=Rhodococcoides trifolii TaxID=908250 RepID=A0A917G852_9NOCA|nr:helix-turn-helix transcriptional regulator [Rhodococcus trifolii]GGG28362.1 LuxR family transcriptional regulator [Rhodococcus trifolii]